MNIENNFSEKTSFYIFSLSFFFVLYSVFLFSSSFAVVARMEVAAAAGGGAIRESILIFFLSVFRCR